LIRKSSDSSNLPEFRSHKPVADCIFRHVAPSPSVRQDACVLGRFASLYIKKVAGMRFIVSKEGRDTPEQVAPLRFVALFTTVGELYAMSPHDKMALGT
jgi:hypothetical protein